VASQIYTGALRLVVPPSLDGTSAGRPTGAWISLVRILVLLTLIPASWVGIIPVTEPNSALATGVVLLLGGYVVLLTIGPRHMAALRKNDLIIMLDILMITLVTIVSGGLTSPFRYLYYLTILEAAALVDLRQALAASVASAAIIILLWTRDGRAELLERMGFHVGAFIVGGFCLALFTGALIQERRSALDLFKAYETTIEGWSHALDLRDKETEGHSRRVTELTVRLAYAMGMSKRELVHVRRGALLHDIGKMGIPDNILLKPGPLTADEWNIMRKHPLYAYELLSPIAYLHPALDIPYCHHEKWDGTGYPRGLRGEEIPLAARCFAVADVWDALRSDRPYAAAASAADAREHIRKQAGKHFDPRAVEIFLQLEPAHEAPSSPDGQPGARGGPDQGEIRRAADEEATPVARSGPLGRG